MVQKVAAIGVGVVGLSCAVKIAEAANNDTVVCLFSDKFSPYTTGDGSAGLWGPYLIGDTPSDKINKRSQDCHQFFHELWKSGKAAEVGLSLVPVTRLATDGNGFNSCWSRVVLGFTPLSYAELDRYRKEHLVDYVAGANFVTFACEPTRFLPYLMRRFKSAGGKVFEKRITSFDDLSEEFDLIVNCTGLGAKTLTNDEQVKPIRGQVQRVEASWLFHTILNDTNYIIPNINTVVLGGTGQVNDYNETVSDDDSIHIRIGCLNLDPSVANSTFKNEWVGLRPGRDTIRLEEEIFHKPNGRTCRIIHNYGHGGSGVTTAWGCATDVLELVKQHGVSSPLKSRL